MKSKDGISTVEKIKKYKEKKQFSPDNDLFWDVRQQEESDNEAPEEMSFHGFTKKATLKMSSKAKKALKEDEEDSGLLLKESGETHFKAIDKPETFEKDIEDEKEYGLDELYSSTEIDAYDNTHLEKSNATIIRSKIPFNFKSDLLTRKRKENDIYLDREKQNHYIKKQKYKNIRN